MGQSADQRGVRLGKPSRSVLCVMRTFCGADALSTAIVAGDGGFASGTEP